MEAIAGALTSYTNDLKEGVASFREKRATTSPTTEISP
jgi:hypothetical protein